MICKPKENNYDAVLWAAGLIYMILSILYFFYGHVHVDEGSYTYAAYLVSKGKLPYIDFYYNQAPLYPYIYGFFQSFLGSGIYAGRGISVFFSFMTFLLSISLGKKLEGRLGAIFAAGLLAFNSFQIYFFTITRLYALTGFFLTLSVFILFTRIKNPWRNVLAAIIMTIAAGVRFTVFPGLAVFLLCLIIKERNGRKNFIYPIFASMLTLVVIFGPFLFMEPHLVLYDNLGAYMQIDTGGPLRIAAIKLSLISELVKLYFFPLLLIIFLLANFLFSSSKKLNLDSYISILWAVAAIIALSHIMGNYSQKSYQTIIYPMITVLIGAGMARVWGEIETETIRKGLMATFMVGCLLTLISDGHSYIIPTVRQHSLSYIKDIVAFIQDNTTPSDKIISSSSPLFAVQSGRELLHGFEGNEYHPEWSIEQAEKVGVINNEILHDYLAEKTAKAVIFSDASFTISFPSFRPLSPDKREKVIKMIQEYYYLGRAFPYIHNSELKIYVYLPK